MYKDIADKLIKWIYNKVKNDHGHGCIIGLSGGVDSSVAAALCKEAFPKSTLGIHILCHGLAADADDAQMVAEALSIEYKTVDLNGVYDPLVMTLKSAEDRPGGLSAPDPEQYQAQIAHDRAILLCLAEPGPGHRNSQSERAGGGLFYQARRRSGRSASHRKSAENTGMVVGQASWHTSVYCQQGALCWLLARPDR